MTLHLVAIGWAVLYQGAKTIHVDIHVAEESAGFEMGKVVSQDGKFQVQVMLGPTFIRVDVWDSPGVKNVVQVV